MSSQRVWMKPLGVTSWVNLVLESLQILNSAVKLHSWTLENANWSTQLKMICDNDLSLGLEQYSYLSMTPQTVSVEKNYVLYRYFISKPNYISYWTNWSFIWKYGLGVGFSLSRKHNLNYSKPQRWSRKEPIQGPRKIFHLRYVCNQSVIPDIKVQTMLPVS